jgi:hypothetical protein
MAPVVQKPLNHRGEPGGDYFDRLQVVEDIEWILDDDSGAVLLFGVTAG